MTSALAPALETRAGLPAWATPVGVHVILGSYFLVFAVIATFLHSGLGVDSAIENYNAQSLATSYSGRNPPLYDWILYAIQRVTGPGKASFAILNYGAIYACLMIYYRVARRVIADPRHQAAAAYALTLLWDIGHESHRILTHSNLMIVAIAGCVLLLVTMRDNRTAGYYLALGLVAALGMLSKFGFAAFAATAVSAAVAVPPYRRIVVDRRIFVTVLAALVPVGAFYIATLSIEQSIVVETGQALSSAPGSGFGERIVALSRALFGYIVPLAPIALFVCFIRPHPAERRTTAHEDEFRRFALIQLALGVAVAAVWVLVLGSTQVRPRYFHALLLNFPIATFAVIQIYGWTVRQLRIFLGIALAVAIGIMAEQVTARLYPAQGLCGPCRLSVPFDRLGRVLAERFGKNPTVVALDPYRAGQMRVGLPQARFVSLQPVSYRPPARATGQCIAVWQDDTPQSELAPLLAAIGQPATVPEAITVPWFQPLLRDQRSTTWNVLSLPSDAPVCR